MSSKKGKPVEVMVVNIFKNPEEQRKSLFLDTMTKTIARSEKNLRIIPTGSSVNN
ncbi:hypothetical protein Ami103574_09270 [Aminipila butyrica]|uniref:Uncharacterized protein n=1 Tax=Aminipila butyrica TaxID=433296 RepID=A0A858BZI9_9FIRM|nr:hypothetical protein [Aminipila butyrica]QIB69506.1 hypothetical protein Ami103574_09270 [Aminipila butyrica]